MNRLKASEDIPSILKRVDQHSKDVAQLVQRRTPTGVEGNFSSQESTFGMVKGPEMRSTHASIPQTTEFVVGSRSKPWSSVTQDSDLVQHLLDLYFTWQHSFFQSFPEDLFRDDLIAGRTKYCSSMLVNAICAAGSMLWHNEAASGFVEKFYAEATKLLREESSPTITTTATLFLTSYVEGTKGRLSALWMSSGASALMAQDLNLQLRRHAKQESPEKEREVNRENNARCHAFWGCFHVDQYVARILSHVLRAYRFFRITSITLGRLPIFNGHGVTVDLPPISDEYDQKPWHPVDSQGPDRPGARSSTFRSCADLSMLINGTLQMFFAPTVPLSGSLLVKEHEKYEEWKKSLPPILSNIDNAPPHLLTLQ